MSGVIAIVGRPNVGKSTIFNRIAGNRVSIVEDVPGVTRDRIYATGDWTGHHFQLIDTGGIQMEDQPYQTEIRAQVQIAIEEADVIIMVTDGKHGITDDDRYIAGILQRSHKPVVLAVNQIDDESRLLNIYEFYELGLGDPIAVSGVHGIGIGDLLDACMAKMPTEKEKEDLPGIRIAVIGQPNVGKSSLVNRLLHQERSIVSNVQGTTRDAVDTPFVFDGRPYVIVDTAGIRKRGKVWESVEKYSVMRAMKAIENCDVALFLIDGEAGIREQDKHVAGYASEAGKPVIIVVNKWDAVEKDDKSMNAFTEKVRKEFVYLAYAPIIFVSAKTGQRTNQIIPIVDHVYENANRRIATNVLNQVIADTQVTNPAPARNGKRFRIYYATQVAAAPPTFVLSCNDPKLMHFTYQRFLENALRHAFDLEGTPIRIIARKKVSE
ncbi:ribosome biogenesis GTPase Der [Lactimicrobium massiliense]|uniref:ribosome biogenesis GTPase Der n=1 Tax=Lactimicrobium massiliense TaxID=2161814 RepID=UPI000D55C29A|nr:ribosome biogenesis GTPase Der [Lactimicrobium massiliense]MDD6458824.1 ribosome biogenesis GTPase Der [Lactimicrobium massiliense]MDD6725953.1 ribosome biogenesis GTPase Der [Lactimicrobium massiliense]MDY3931807.1 ribosome biogenesis GTPase Der [Erysipelotrichaceae bacterium]